MTMTEVEAKASGLTGMLLAQATLVRLNARGLLSDQDVDETLDAVLSGLEDYPDGTDPVVRKARALADAMARSIVKDRRRPTQNR